MQMSNCLCNYLHSVVTFLMMFGEVCVLRVCLSTFLAIYMVIQEVGKWIFKDMLQFTKCLGSAYGGKNICSFSVKEVTQTSLSLF